jgi:uncharacterized protein YbjQ (UPF0145 family)
MIVTTSSEINGKEIVETFGLVMGNTIRAKWIGADVISGLRQIVGGELSEYTDMLSEAREQAIQRMIGEAKHLKANAIVDARFTTSQVMENAAEILAYGTAVKVKKAKK